MSTLLILNIAFNILANILTTIYYISFIAQNKKLLIAQKLQLEEHGKSILKSIEEKIVK